MYVVGKDVKYVFEETAVTASGSLGGATQENTSNDIRAGKSCLPAHAKVLHHIFQSFDQLDLSVQTPFKHPIILDKKKKSPQTRVRRIKLHLWLRSAQ
ncbi:uncharacterized protein DFL_002594 [Arthrobotrys flagrans]|uniref:Uncharacterized protein n=1 Tax=Arthrobotrys flagrans TaxID=97331 RepID=A0A437AC32_ARTFL|nr:hypothetical protein DFL_002594 [Arthrobotrys flagrans]